MPLSPLEQAFEETLSAAAEVKGFRQKVRFREVLIDCLVETDVVELVPMGGGIGDVSPVKISVRKSDVVLPIANLEPIFLQAERDAAADYEEKAVFSWAPLEGRVDLIVGDPAQELEGMS